MSQSPAAIWQARYEAMCRYAEQLEAENAVLHVERPTVEQLAIEILQRTARELAALPKRST